VDKIMSRVLAPAPGMEIHDPCCASGGLLIKCKIAMEDAEGGQQEGGHSCPPSSSSSKAARAGEQAEGREGVKARDF